MLKSLFPWKHHKTKAMAAQQTMDDEVPEIEPQSQELLPCHVCGRTFLAAPLRKHERICEKTSTKKRKPFDSLKQRVEGTDLADFHQKTYLKKPEPSYSPDLKKRSRSTWKEKHLALVSAIRAAKGIPTDPSIALPKTKSTTALMAGTERCPSCDRQFGPKAYDRHVEWCKEKKAQQRIHHSPANVLLAKERLEARTKYVPPLNRSKKTIIREKYSNHASTETLVSVKSPSPLSRGPSVRKPRSVIDMGRNSEKTSNNEKPRFEKSVSGGGDKAKAQENSERCVPVIASPSSKSELSKSLQKKRTTIPFTKLNNVKVNNQIDGLTVASLVYDTSSKKMVTWKDTLKKTSENETQVNFGGENSNDCTKISKSSSCSLEVPCKVTQSEKLQKNREKVQCDKILSCNDVVHKKQPRKIPLSKYSFKSKLNLTDERNKRMMSGRRTDDAVSIDSNTTITVRSSSTDLEELNVDIDKSSSCNSVANAFERLKINSEHDLEPEEIEEIQLSPVSEQRTEVLESDSLVDVALMENDGENELDELIHNGHREMSNWFDEFVKKSESVDCIDSKETETYDNEIDKVVPIKEEPTKVKDENLVLLFRSPTNMDLTKETSDLILPAKKSEEGLKNDTSQETFVTNCELDSVELSYRKPSHFSLKKSVSDIYLDSVRSNVGLSNKNTLISIYWNKNKEVSDEESFADTRKMISSLPNITLNEVVYKTSAAPVVSKEKVLKQNELLRRKILEIAANEFVEDCRVKNLEEAVRQENESGSDDPLLKFLDEEYTVPKKRRKVDGTYARLKKQKVFRFSAIQNFDLAKFKALTVSENANVLEYRNDGDTARKTDRSDVSSCGSSSINFKDYSPRIFAILDNVLNGDRHPVSDKGLVVMTPSDCRRLIDLDKDKLPELEQRLRKIKQRQAKKYSDTLKLPVIENGGIIPKEDKEVQVSEALHLPQIVNKKLRRRDNMKKLVVDIKQETGDVYLEYDSESIASTKGVNSDKKKSLSSLKRSMTLIDHSPKPPSLKNKNDVNNYFSEQEQKASVTVERNTSSPVKELSDLLDETLKPEDLFNVDDEMYEEYKKYEEMYLKEKSQQSATKKHKTKIVDINLGIHTASEEEEHAPQFNNKISNDSAYGSLTRKTPKHRSRATKLTPLEQKRADSSSSSGSENCPSSPAPVNQRLSKFCHECGNRYPVTTAKFCVECGVRRLVL